MKTQLKILAFTLATFNLTQAAADVINEKESTLRKRNVQTEQLTEYSQTDALKANPAVENLLNKEVTPVKPRDSRCGYIMSYFKSIPSIYDLPSTLSVYASDVYKAVSEKAQVVYNSTAKNVAYYTKAAREKVWGTSGRISKEETEVLKKEKAAKEEQIKEDVAKKTAQKEQDEANEARKKAAEETSQQRPAKAKEDAAKRAAEAKWTNDSETNDIVKNRKLAAAAKKQKEAFSAAQKIAEERKAKVFDSPKK